MKMGQEQPSMASRPSPPGSSPLGSAGRAQDCAGDSPWYSLIIFDVVRDVILQSRNGTGAAGFFLSRGSLLYLDHLGLEPSTQAVVTHIHVLINLQEARQLRGPSKQSRIRVKDLSCGVQGHSPAQPRFHLA